VLEGVQAFLAGVAFFLLAAVAIPLRDSAVVIVLVGAICVYVVVQGARRWGPRYGVPLAIAGGLAFDSFYIPPTREFGQAFWQNWLVMVIYISAGVLVGMLSARAQHRAEASERARAVLSTEQAALRRVATMVARGAAPDDVFAAVAEEVGTLLGVDGARVVRGERDDEVVQLAAWHAPGLDPRARELGARSDVTAPIVVEGRRWGAVVAWQSHPRPLPAAAEARLAEFTELIAAAVSNTASRDGLARLADEQAALTRVATLVARASPATDVFTAVAREVGLLLGVDATHMGRYEVGGAVTHVAAWSRTGELPPVEMDYSIQGKGVIARVAGFRSSAAAPIVVDGRLWGVMVASSNDVEPLPADTESRIAAFNALVATAISNTEARAELRSLADEQAALRRVATLVADDAPPGVVFDAVAEEVGRLLGTDLAGMICYQDDDAFTPMATWSAAGPHADIGGQWPLEGGGLATTIAQTGLPGRIDDWNAVDAPVGGFARGELGLRNSVGSPIVVDGRLWGALIVHSKSAKRLARDAESRLTHFTELVATAISNGEARLEVRRLADEQAALRRVATLVARDASPSQVFAAIAAELGLLLDVDDTTMYRYDDDHTAVVVADWAELRRRTAVGERLTLDGSNVATRVLHTGRAARFDDYSAATGSIAELGRADGISSAAGSPIVVDDRLWGAIVAASRHTRALPADTEARMEQFTELAATAISNIEARREVAASRARIVAATDAERRRVVRDLHDGAQQRMVHTIITLKLAHRALNRGDEAASTLLTEALVHADGAISELRELAHGILPAVLTRGGLRAGVDALATRMSVPVENGVAVGRLPVPIEATAYFVVAEALTNVAKHAHARQAAVVARVEDGTLRLDVRDDGVGGARADGSGLLGLADRLAVVDGRLRVESPAHGGTLVAAAIPLIE
jgi:signal transduction histidine kinase